MSFLKNILKWNAGSTPEQQTIRDIYGFSAVDIDGVEHSFSKYNGHVCLIVNVACKCGFTDNNYTQLQELYAKYSEQGLRILAFPCNQFASQEPWSENQIKDFVKQYNVGFDMFSKIEVNGSNAHPLYQYLKHCCPGTMGDFIKWNFSKFLINKQGKAVKRFAPNIQPLDIEQDIISLLKE